MPRPLRSAALSLAAGLVLSLLIAIAFALLGTGPITPTARITFDSTTSFSPAWRMTADQTGWGWTRRSRALVRPQSYGVAGAAQSAALSFHLESSAPPFPVALPPRGTIADLDPAVRAALGTGTGAGTLVTWPVQTRFGWPARCLAYWNDGIYGWGAFGYATAGSRGAVAWGAELRRGPNLFDGVVLPLDPLISGLTLDTAFFGALVFAAIFGVRSARALRRRRGGRCEGCGYEVGVLPRCPECGRARLIGLRAT